MIEIILIIYSFVILITKLIILIIVSKKDVNKNIFIDLGVSYLNNQDNNFYLFSTFFGDLLVLIINIIAVIIEKVIDIYDDDEEVVNIYKTK